jgi:hypothetical protein
MATPSTGKQADPAYRRDRASKAGRAAHSLAAHVRAIVAKAAELTGEQREQLALALDRGGKP